MATRKETVRLLLKSIVNRLENDKSIAFPPRLRQIVQDELYHLVGPYILTDEDLRERALAKIGSKSETLAETSFSETDAYKAAKALVRGTFGDDELNGFYFQKPLKTVAGTMVQYFMRSSHIDDVYESDEDLELQIVETVKRFDAAELH